MAPHQAPAGAAGAYADTVMKPRELGIRIPDSSREGGRATPGGWRRDPSANEVWLASSGSRPQAPEPS
jgi:hypothetical protein